MKEIKEFQSMPLCRDAARHQAHRRPLRSEALENTIPIDNKVFQPKIYSLNDV